MRVCLLPVGNADCAIIFFHSYLLTLLPVEANQQWRCLAAQPVLLLLCAGANSCNPFFGHHMMARECEGTVRLATLFAIPHARFMLDATDNTCKTNKNKQKQTKTIFVQIPGKFWDPPFLRSERQHQPQPGGAQPLHRDDCGVAGAAHLLNFL
jgi:hypothetical protein